MNAPVTAPTGGAADAHGSAGSKVDSAEVVTDARPTRRLSWKQIEPRLYWLSPLVVSLFVAVGAITPAFLLDDDRYRALWRTPKSVTPDVLLLFLSGALALSLGALIASSIFTRADPRLATAWPCLNSRSESMLRRASTVLTTITVLGYLGFVIVIAKSGVGIGELFSGSPDVKAAIGTIPGVTTLTQCGMAAVTVAALLLVQRFSRAELCKMLLVVVFGVLRSFINSERLAILELLVPIFVVLVAKLGSRTGARRTLAQWLPVAFGALVVVVFGVSEYFRSWTFYRSHGQSSFTDFVMTRLGGYYATAMNNGYLNLKFLDWPHHVPFDTISGVWSAPGIAQLHLYQKLSGHPLPSSPDAADSPYNTMLIQHANPEFNSESGYSGPFLDYGHVGGIIFFLLAGLLAGYLFKRFTSAHPVGLLAYPVFFVGLLEMPRYMYWSYGRVVPTWIAVVVIVYLMTRHRNRTKERA